jgi:hypothetical protein
LFRGLPLVEIRDYPDLVRSRQQCLLEIALSIFAIGPDDTVAGRRQGIAATVERFDNQADLIIVAVVEPDNLDQATALDCACAGSTTDSTIGRDYDESRNGGCRRPS